MSKPEEVTPRPYAAAQDGDSYTFVGEVSPAMARGFAMPKDLDNPKLEAFLTWALNHPGKSNQGELRAIRDQWDGGKAALSAKYFPKPKGADPELWAQNKKLMTHVNLVGTAIRTWVNAVYSEEAYRKASNCDKAVTGWIESDEYASSMYAWAENKTAFGESVAVPRWDEDLEELYTWLPDPVHTIIKRDPNNRRRIIGVAEVTSDRLEFVSIYGEGYLSADGFAIEVEELDWLPAVIGGDGRLPMVRDSVSATYAACVVLYNTRVLQKQQTRSLLVRKDDLSQLKAVGGGRVQKGTDSGSIDLSDKGDAKYISPDPKIKESIEVLRQIIIVLATASGIPADVLDPTLTESASSAEGSRIRAIPFIQNSKPLMRAWRSDERSLAIAGEYLMTRVRNNPRKYKEVREAVIVDIGLSTASIPMSANEETQNIIAKVSFGLMTPEDAVRQLNGTKTEAQVEEMAEEMKRRMEASAQALAQKALGGGRPPEQTGAGGSVKTAA